jgi:hypothetical protein
LTGTWRSNLELTQNYNNKYAKLTERQQNALSQMFGKMEVNYFEPGRCKIYLPKNTVHTEKKDYEFDGSEEVFEYEIIYRDDKVVVIVFDDPEAGKTVRTINFTSCNTYWLYLGGGSIIDLNMREYFTKIE